MQYNSKAVMPPLILRCKSVSGPFQVRSLEWAKNGTYMGGTRESLGSNVTGAFVEFLARYLFGIVGRLSPRINLSSTFLLTIKFNIIYD